MAGAKALMGAVVFAIHRHEDGTVGANRLHYQPAGRDQDFLIGEAHALAAANRFVRGFQAGYADNG